MTVYPLFLALLRDQGIPEPVTELVFAPPRKFRFDYCWPSHKVALEVQGGLFIRGRHSGSVGQLRDMDKFNLAAIRGWRILQVVPKTLATTDTLNLIREALK